tara:strand:+ start:367 stop:789 length:423 start_codon:yes stop_codon:yes gene_type:complete
MGRPLKLNDAIVARIMEATAKGHPREMVAHYAGLNPSTLYRWINLGREGKQPYQAFVRKLEQAKAQGLHGLLSTIERASKDQWQAAAWLAERCHGMTKDAPPPVQITIDAESMDVRALVQEYKKEILPMIEPPNIDLDED